MNKKNTTKRALIMSLLALLLCVSMLVGSTYAWFTDSVSSNGNRIVAGKLEIDLLMDKEANNNYVSIADGTGDIFDVAAEATNSPKTLWEPGKTQIVYLKVENKGTLDLRYNVMLNITDNGLAGALEYAIIDGAKATDLAPATSWDDIKAIPTAQKGNVAAGTFVAAPNGALAADGEDFFALAVHMKEEASNDYQEKDIVIDVLVQATQLASEKDSFGSDYDKLATFNTGFHWVEPIDDHIIPAADNSFEYENEDGTVKISGTAENGDPVNVKVAPASTDANITIAGSTVLSYDIDVIGRAAGSDVTLEIFVGTNLPEVKLYHEGVLMDAAKYTYNSLTGFLKFTTDSFSVYSVSFSDNLPLAIVKELKGDDLSIEIDGALGAQTLTSGYQFQPSNTYEEALESEYRYWHADFVISADKDVRGDSIALAGYYQLYCDLVTHGKWVAISGSENDIIPAGTELRLVTPEPNTTTSNSVDYRPLTVNYEELCNYGNDGIGFLCGVVPLDEEALKGTTITVELRLFKTYSSEDCIEKFGYSSTNVEYGPDDYVVIGSYQYTFK